MLIFALLLTGLMITVIIADFTRYIIPNWLVGIILLLYPVMVCFSPARPDWKMALLVGLGVFAIGFLLFSIGAIGGGDVKLLSVATLWVGKGTAIQFFIGVSILGGVLAIALWLVRHIIRYLFLKREKKPALLRVLTVGEPMMPYGIAIAVAFLMLLWMGSIPGIPVSL